MLRASVVITINPSLNKNEVRYMTNLKIGMPWIQKKMTTLFGNKKAKILINSIHSKSKEEKFEVSLDVARSLRLPFETTTMNLNLELAKNQIKIGPLIGIFIRRRKNNKNLSNLQRAVLHHYFNHAKQLNYYAFAFSAEDIDWEKQIIHGYISIDNQKIVKRTVPFPDVMYDQNASRTYEKQKNVIVALSKLHQMIPHFFNPGYLNKWEIYEYISNHETAKIYHPPTILLDNVSLVSKEVIKYGLVFIKPINGSQGKGIITVFWNGQFFEYKYQGNTLIEGKSKSAKKLEEFISNIVKNRIYIIQKGLPLVKYNDCPVDIRVLMQKNEKGKWIRTKAFARVSKPGSFTSNLSLGGEAKTIDEVLQEQFSPNKIKNVKKKLRNASRIIVTALEEQSQQLFGELGLDLGITHDGQVWLIEINSKPWKTIETKDGTEELVEKSFMRPIQYAGYLANQGE